MLDGELFQFGEVVGAMRVTQPLEDEMIEVAIMRPNVGVLSPKGHGQHAFLNPMHGSHPHDVARIVHERLR